VVTVIDAGRIINLKTGRNQVEGAVVMGVGMDFNWLRPHAKFAVKINTC
jgi:hypothetical protein